MQHTFIKMFRSVHKLYILCTQCNDTGHNQFKANSKLVANILINCNAFRGNALSFIAALLQKKEEKKTVVKDNG